MRRRPNAAKPSITCDVVTTDATLKFVIATYNGSDGDATKRMYERLTALGTPLGSIAINLFRAQKASARAKVYRGGGFRGMAYDRKQWSMGNLCDCLTTNAEAISMTWGWQKDHSQSYHSTVLYLDLPSGQVSFHTDQRGVGPDYPGEWDGLRGMSAERVCRFVASVLDGHSATGACKCGDGTAPIIVTAGKQPDGTLRVVTFCSTEHAAQQGFDWVGRSVSTATSPFSSNV